MKPGYCTNIHSGATLREVVANLQRYAVPVKKMACPDEPMGVGLWLSCAAVNETLDGDNWRELSEVLHNNGLVPNTFNAFPFDDFHQPIVKHRVYQPAWDDASRLDYTLQVARLMARLLPPDASGSISTLPLGWPAETGNEELKTSSARNLGRCARELATIRDETSRTIRLAIEPEPGCVLSTSIDLCDFFSTHLDALPEKRVVREFTGVCHDACHAAVMFESAQSSLDRYQRHGVRIVKVQLSSAIEARLTDMRDAIRGDESNDRHDLLSELAAFAEPRYLHQTCIRTGDGTTRFFEDLGPALKFLKDREGGALCRTHFHVPVHLESIGRLRTTRDSIPECLAWIRGNLSAATQPDVEVETYAWSVSPKSLGGDSLEDSIAHEIRWVHQC